MAVTKIHPIKSTLKKALDYITNPVKTDDKLYVSSFGCAVETADIEFEKTRLRAMNSVGIFFVKACQIPEDLSLGVTFYLFTFHSSLKPRGFGR